MAQQRLSLRPSFSKVFLGHFKIALEILTNLAVRSDGERSIGQVHPADFETPPIINSNVIVFVPAVQVVVDCFVAQHEFIQFTFSDCAVAVQINDEVAHHVVEPRDSLMERGRKICQSSMAFNDQ